MSFQAASICALRYGEGHGPDAGPAPPLSFRHDTIRSSLSAERGSGVYWAVSRFHRNAPEGMFTPGAEMTVKKAAPSVNNTVWASASDGGTGREVLGNIFSVLIYTTQAAAYEVVGPYHSMIHAYSKSIAHADYFTITERRRLWERQRKRQLALWELSRISEGAVDDRKLFFGKNDEDDQGTKNGNNNYRGLPLAHKARLLLEKLHNVTSGSEANPKGVRPFRTQFVTMASRDTPNLQNLIFSARFSGLPLDVVGMLDKDEGTKNDSTPFNYAEKIVAFYNYVVSSLAENTLLSDDILVMVDAYDVLLLPAARRIGQYVYAKSPTPIISCAENGVYPEGPSAFAYNHHQYRFFNEDDADNLDQRFLNSGCIAGRVGQVFAMLQAAYDLRDVYRNDQQFYVRYHLSHPDLLSLDYGYGANEINKEGEEEWQAEKECDDVHYSQNTKL